jgi:uncharacterized glyoxalase superfamily protein PhnB
MMDYRKITPNLIVENVSRTVDFYEQMLDFELVMGVPEDSQQVVTTRDPDAPLAFAMIKRGPVELMFQSRRSAAKEWSAMESGSAIEGIALYIEVADVRRLHAWLKGKATLLKDLHTTFYGMDEFYIRDCNGCVLGLASPHQERAT